MKKISLAVILFLVGIVAMAQDSTIHCNCTPFEFEGVWGDPSQPSQQSADGNMKVLATYAVQKEHFKKIENIEGAYLFPFPNKSCSSGFSWERINDNADILKKLKPKCRVVVLKTTTLREGVSITEWQMMELMNPCAQ